MENGFAPDEIEASIIYEDLEVVKAWLDAGGDPNAKTHPAPGSQDVPNWSLLQLAASGGNVEIISLLLSRGADVNCTDAHGRSALYICINHLYKDCLPAIRVLLAHGADVNLAAQRGKTPVMMAAEQDEELEELVLMEEPYTNEQVWAALAKGTLEGAIQPTFAGSALKNLT